MKWRSDGWTTSGHFESRGTRSGREAVGDRGALGVELRCTAWHWPFRKKVSTSKTLETRTDSAQTAGIRHQGFFFLCPTYHKCCMCAKDGQIFFVKVQQQHCSIQFAARMVDISIPFLVGSSILARLHRPDVCGFSGVLRYVSDVATRIHFQQFSERPFPPCSGQPHGNCCCPLQMLMSLWSLHVPDLIAHGDQGKRSTRRISSRKFHHGS